MSTKLTQLTSLIECPYQAHVVQRTNRSSARFFCVAPAPIHPARPGHIEDRSRNLSETSLRLNRRYPRSWLVSAGARLQKTPRNKIVHHNALSRTIHSRT